MLRVQDFDREPISTDRVSKTFSPIMESTVSYVVGAVVAIGGLVGYLKARSVPR